MDEQPKKGGVPKKYRCKTTCTHKNLYYRKGETTFFEPFEKVPSHFVLFKEEENSKYADKQDSDEYIKSSVGLDRKNTAPKRK